MLFPRFSVLGLLIGTSMAAWDVTPFKINLSKEAARMKSLVTSYRLPSQPLYADLGFTNGTSLEWFKALQQTWAHDFDWDKTQARMNRFVHNYLFSISVLMYTISSFSHYKVTIEGVAVHFIHKPSSNKNAIPLILNHGWPGSFYEFDHVIEPLANPSNGEQAFHVVVPSLLGFGFSAPPPSFAWNNTDTARIFTTLMTDVLGYKEFGAEGGDWVRHCFNFQSVLAS